MAIPLAQQTQGAATDTRLTRYLAAREAALQVFAKHSRIRPLWRGLTQATDLLLKSAAEEKGVTLVAVGGYGRRELFPYSDVDVLMLSQDDSANQPVISLLQELWDHQIQVSHATRSVEATIAAAKADHTISTALMDARYLAGDRAQFRALKDGLKREVYGSAKRAYVEAKLSERDKRHEKWGDSRFMLEPNIKEGKGALRDLQTLGWLARYCYNTAKAGELVREDLLTAAEWRHYRAAYMFFATVRAQMHLLRGRADERLTFDLQTQIATALKFRGKTPQARAERFMLRYFQFARHVGALTRIFCAILEEENLRSAQAPRSQDAIVKQLPDYVAIENGRLNFSTATDLARQPWQMVGLFALAQQHGLDVHPRAHLRLTRSLGTAGRKLPHSAEANRLLLQILLSPKAPELSLRRMNEMGVLGTVLPEFGRIIGQMQYDGYHTYTVDEHTLVAVGNLTALESGIWAGPMPLSTAVAKEIADRAPLYLGMLCHDIAKGMGGAHAQKGESIVLDIARRLGLSDEQGELASWLVKSHLSLSETAFKRDLDDPKTISDFVAFVQSPERLRLLLLITVADIKAVGPQIWNGWKGSLMRELYRRAMAQMGVAAADADRSEQEEQRAALLAEVPESQHDAAQHILQQTLPAGWWYRPRAEQLTMIATYAAWKTKPAQPAITITHDTFRAVTDVTCCMENRPELFRLLAGVMAWIGASIVSARILVLADNVAIATIGIQDLHGGSFAEEERRLARLPQLIDEALAGKLAFARELPRRKLVSRGREVAVRPAVFLDNQVSGSATVIEVNAKDRLGLLHDILGAMANQQLQVMTAHIATYGSKAVDVFYVKNAYGHQITHPAKLEQVQRAILDACEVAA